MHVMLIHTYTNACVHTLHTHMHIHTHTLHTHATHIQTHNIDQPWEQEDRSLMVQWVFGSILHGGPIELFLVPANAPRLV